MDLQKLQASLKSEANKLPPVDKWNPDFCGDIDLTIKHNGQWFYMGTPIGRQALVKLFASVLKKEGEHYFLVTPVEKVGIHVEDVPLLVTDWQWQDHLLVMETSVGDRVVVSYDNPITLQKDKVSGEVLPYLLVRRNLLARLHQNVFYQLVEQGDMVGDGDTHQVKLSSGDYLFSLGYC